jgi:hypothetical protein
VEGRSASLPDGVVERPYDEAVPGAAAAPSWRVAGGTLPPGLMLDATSGHVRGTPSQAGDFEFSVAAGRGDATAPLHLTLRVRPVRTGATSPAETPAAITWQGTDDYRLFQHVPAGDQISTAHVTIALTEEPGGTLHGTADGSVDATLTLSTCPSRTVSPARFHAELAGTRTDDRMELQVVNPLYGPIEITPCPKGGMPGVIGGGKILDLDAALQALVGTDGDHYRFHSETTYPSGMYSYTVTHTVGVHRASGG